MAAMRQHVGCVQPAVIESASTFGSRRDLGPSGAGGEPLKTLHRSVCDYSYCSQSSNFTSPEIIFLRNSQGSSTDMRCLYALVAKRSGLSCNAM